MIKNICFLVIVFLVVSCTPVGLDTSAESVAAFWHANEYNVSDSGEGTNKMVIVSIEELPGVNVNYPLKNVADISAVKFADNLTDEERDEYPFVKMMIKSNGISFEKKYQLAEILLAHKFVKISQSFFIKINESDYSVIDNLFDSTKFVTSERAKIKALFHKIDSVNGKCNNISFLNFELKSVDADKKPVIMMHTDVSYNNSFADYLFVFRVQDEKIIHFSLNEKSK